MAGLAGGWVFYFGIGLTAVATALLFVKAIRRDRRLALFLAPAAANAALLLLSFSFYGQLSVESLAPSSSRSWLGNFYWPPS